MFSDGGLRKSQREFRQVARLTEFVARICDIHQKLVNIAFELVAERGKEEKMKRRILCYIALGPKTSPSKPPTEKKWKGRNYEGFGAKGNVTQNSSFRLFVFLHQRNLKNGIVTLQGHGGGQPPRERELEPNTNYTVSDYQLDFRNRKVKF